MNVCDMSLKTSMNHDEEQSTDMLELRVWNRTDGDDDILELRVWNDKTGDRERGNFQYMVRMADGTKRYGELKSFRMAQSYGAARLMAAVMKKEFPVEPELRYSHEVRGGQATNTETT